MQTTKVPVLVSGGAGFIGSHAVLALKDNGWPVAVIDNLTTGFAASVPDGVALYEGDIADTKLLARIFAQQGTQAIDDFLYAISIDERSSSGAWTPVLWPLRGVIPLTAFMLALQGVSELLKSLWAWRTGEFLTRHEKIEV